MPNWVFNSLVVSGDELELNKMIAQLNQPFVKHFPQHDFVDGKLVKTADEQVYDNPVFAFWNIVKPTDLDAYYGEEIHKKTGLDGKEFMQEFIRSIAEDQDWYHWNVRNWGTKWDVAVDNNSDYSDTSMEWTDNGEVMYRFNTAWSPVGEALTKLSEQYPTLEFDYEYEEEQGWGGKAIITNGEYSITKEWDIPSSHADYENSWMDCTCETEPDYSDYWFEDCPVDTTKYKWDEEMSAWVELEEMSDPSAMLQTSN